MSPQEMRSIWQRIESWFAAHHPALDLKLRPSANATEIVAAETALGVAFPEDLRASMLVHDGQEDDPELQLVPFAQRLGSVASLTTCWTDDRNAFDDAEMKTRFDWLDDTQRVRQVHFHPKRIPFAGSPYWDYGRLLLDFIPGPNGRLGQVIARNDVELEFVCVSFGELLEKTARGLENGSIEVRNGSYASELAYLSAKRAHSISPADYFSAP